MSRGAVARRMLLWITLVAYCAVGMAMGAPPEVVLGFGPFRQVSLYQLLLVAGSVFALGDMRRAIFDHEPSLTRTITRILLVYLSFEVLVVIPVAIGHGSDLGTILATMTPRFAWLLMPTVWALSRDDRTRNLVGAIPLVAAAALATWGLYASATGGGGWYLEGGDLRYRVLWGGSTALFAWPFVAAVSGALPRRLAGVFLGVGLIGLTLTNHRSGFIAFAVAAVFCLVASGSWWRVIVLWSVPVALAAVIVGLLATPRIVRVFGYTVSALFDFSEGNGAARIVQWRLAWQSFATRPFNDYVWSWSHLRYGREPSVPHNFVLQIATTEGLAGLAFYGAIVWTTFRAGWSWVRRDVVVRTLVGYIIAYLTFALANTNLYSLLTAPLLVAAVAGTIVQVEQLRAGGPDAKHQGDEFKPRTDGSAGDRFEYDVV